MLSLLALFNTVVSWGLMYFSRSSFFPLLPNSMFVHLICILSFIGLMADERTSAHQIIRKHSDNNLMKNNYLESDHQFFNIQTNFKNDFPTHYESVKHSYWLLSMLCNSFTYFYFFSVCVAELQKWWLCCHCTERQISSECLYSLGVIWWTPH